jgi:1-acyl-sn-glycerol-3-phosphate acyltransferase
VKLPGVHWWRTVLFLIPTVTAYTAALGTLSLFFGLIEPRGKLAHVCARVWSWLILATTGAVVDTEGLGNIDPRGTYVFVSNHQSLYDIPVVFASLPYQLRIIAKVSLGRVPFIGWHLRRSGHLLVDRKNPDRARILRRWKALVGEGLSLIVFPEGTRSVDGTLGPFKAGSFLLAIEAGLPLVPMTISGSRLVMSKGQLTARPGRVRLVIHEPMPTEGLTPSDARALADRVRSIVERGSSGHPSESLKIPGSGKAGSAVPAAAASER